MVNLEIDGHEVSFAGRIEPHNSEPTIVFIHGAAMDHTVWAMHTRYFMHVRRSVVALDLPAHGRSDGVPLPSIEMMSAWVSRCLDRLGIERIALAGHSMGALVALELAADNTDRVATLALLGAAVPMAVSEELLDAARQEDAVALDMMVLWGHAYCSQLGGNPVAGIPVIHTAKRLLERARPGVLFNDLSACHNYRRGKESALKITAKTTLVCGTEDKMTPLRAGRDLAEFIPGCSVRTIPQCGHLLMSEQPEDTHRKLVTALG